MNTQFAAELIDALEFIATALRNGEMTPAYASARLNEMVAILNGDMTVISQYTKLPPIEYSSPMRLRQARFWTTKKE